MEKSAPHIIRRTSVELDYTGNKQGLELQQEITDWCRNVLGPCIDSALAEFDQMEEVIYIDQVRVNLEMDITGDWMTAMTDEIVHQLKNRIRSGIGGKDKDVKTKPESEKFSGVLIYFLKYGFLPWNVSNITGDNFHSELARWLQTVSSSEIKKLLLNLAEEIAITRLVNLVNDNEFERILAILSGKQIEKVTRFYKDAGAISGLIIPDKPERQYFQKELMKRLLMGLSVTPVIPILEIYEDLIIHLAERDQVKFRTIDPASIKSPEILDIVIKIKKRDKPRSKTKQKEASGKPADEFKDLTEAEKTETGSTAELKEGVFISNAGAVIIAPFLPALFKKTDLVKDNRITNASSALSLVHFCIIGKTDPVEFELLLPKILCGIETSEVLEVIPVSDKQILAEADEMLASAIEHWSVLKNTSVEGLREAFLQRNGKLSFDDNEWLLQVEQMPYDMLLQQLPWNISMIKLPWMKSILRTQWI